MMAYVLRGLTRCTSRAGVFSSAMSNSLREIPVRSFSASHNIQMTDAGVPVGVRILALNNLRDNPGARKKVSVVVLVITMLTLR